MKPEKAIFQIGLFQKLSSTEAECLECEKRLKTAKSSTSGLICHLNSVHRHSEYPKKYADLKLKQGDGTNTVVTGSRNLSAMDKRVINFIACTQHSFLALNNPTTHSLFNGANAMSRLKDESHYRVLVLPIAYEAVKRQVKLHLEKCPAIAFTTNSWSKGSHSFLSLTANCIDEHFKRHSFVLSVSNFEGTHTRERIAQKIREVLVAWRIPNEKCVAFVRDGGTNFRKAFSDPQFNSVFDTDCGAHLVNTIVRGALDNNDEIINVIKKCRRIVGHFKQSPLASHKLNDLQIDHDTKSTHSQKQDMPVRWNATLAMIESLLPNEEPINFYAFGQRRMELTLENFEWQLIAELSTLLKPMDELTRLFCLPASPLSVKHCYSQMIREQLIALEIVDENVQRVRESLVIGLSSRFSPLKEDKNHLLSQFLDARFKQFNDCSEHFRRQIDTWIKVEGESVEEFDEIKPPAAKKMTLIGLLERFSESLAEFDPPASSSLETEASTSGPTGPNLLSEINAYTAMPHVEIEQDPLEFWEQNHKQFPLLAAAARIHLAAPATSVANEQLFSTARDVFNYRRSQLEPDKAEMLVFLKRTLPQLHYQY